MPRQLTPKQLKFIAAYQTGITGVQAAIEAGYSEKTAKHAAYQLMHQTPLVMTELERIAALVSAQAEVNAQTAMTATDYRIERADKANQHSAVAKLLELKFRLAGLLRDKLDITVERADINAALEAAKARVRPMCDPALTIEGEFEALPSSDSNVPIDSQSIRRRIYGGEDIFE